MSGVRLFPLDIAQLSGMLLGQSIRIEEFTDGDIFVVRAEVPGVSAEKDIKVSVFGDRLQISVERTEDRVDKAHTEFHYGSFTRSVQLPLDATVEGIKAAYTDGVLEVRIPLAGKVTPGREIPIEIAGVQAKK